MVTSYKIYACPATILPLEKMPTTTYCRLHVLYYLELLLLQRKFFLDSVWSARHKYSRAFRTSESADFSEVRVFENPSDSDSACLLVYTFILHTVKKSTFHKKNPKFQFFLFFYPIIPFINHMHRYLL
jgi:hypothetical protein